MADESSMIQTILGAIGLAGVGGGGGWGILRLHSRQQVHGQQLKANEARMRKVEDTLTETRDIALETRQCVHHLKSSHDTLSHDVRDLLKEVRKANGGGG